MASKPAINFTDKDFTSIKSALVNYAKLYYPETYKNFNEASFGALMFDNMSHIGDILSFYIDYHGNESFIDSAIQIENIQKLAKQLGYKSQGNPSSFGLVAFFIKIPANSLNAPDTNYLPLLKKDTQVASQNGSSFVLVDDVDFNSELTEYIVLEVDSNGLPTYYAAKTYGRVVSGEKLIYTKEVTTYDGFLKIKIPNQNFVEVLSVIDTAGNEYYKVDYLSQNIIYRPILNTDVETNQFAKYSMQKIYAPRRFVIEKIGDFYYLIFGKGSIDAIVDPSNIVLEYFARDYSSDTFFDPSNIMITDKFGIAPENTILTIRYRANTTNDVNVGINGINSVVSAIFEFPSTATSATIINIIRSSIEVVNELPVIGFVTETTIDELKQKSKDAYASQGRAVTQADYISLVHRMDGKYGSIKRANIVKDRRSIRNNLNLYVLSETKVNNNSILIETNNIVKENLKKWLESRRILSDTVDILDAKIVNLRVSFKVQGKPDRDKKDVEVECISALVQKFSTKFQIGQPFDINDIYKTLNLLDSVVDTKDVLIEVINGSSYNYNNFDINKYLSSDETFIECPDDVCFEIKYPTRDIKSTVLKYN